MSREDMDARPAAAPFDPGPPPQLTWLWVEELAADPTYQRGIRSDRSQRNIARIAERFAWALFGAATVARTAKDSAQQQGGYAIIDGQHRIEAARRLGIRQVPCLIVEAADVAEQARLFVAANRDRVTLNPLGIHAALVAAGDERAQRIARACAAAGVEVLRYPVHAKQLKPGQTLAIGSLGAMAALHGEAALAEALALIREAWPTPGGISAARIRAIAPEVAKRGRAAVAAAIRALGGAEGMDRIAAGAAEAGKSQPAALAEALRRQMGPGEKPTETRKTVRGGRPAAAAAPARAAPPIPGAAEQAAWLARHGGPTHEADDPVMLAKRFLMERGFNPRKPRGCPRWLGVPKPDGSPRPANDRGVTAQDMIAIARKLGFRPRAAKAAAEGRT